METLNEQGPEPTHNDVSNTATRDHEAAQRDAATQAGATLLETSERRPITKVQRIDYSDVPVIRRPSELYQPNRPGTINVPATQPSLDRTRTELARINPKGSVFETEPRTNADIDWSAPPAKLP